MLIESMKRIRRLFEAYKDFNVYSLPLQRLKKDKLARTKNLNEKLETYEKKKELHARLKVLDATLEKLEGKMRYTILSAEREKLKREIEALPTITNADILQEVGMRDADFMTWLNYMSIERIQRLKKPRFKPLFEIVDTKDENERVRKFRAYLRDWESFKHLQEVFPFIASTLHSAVRLGPPAPQFELTIIDEAGQATIAHALPAMLRGQQLLLVGDPNQLEPVVSMEETTNRALKRRYQVQDVYDYKENSILKLMMQVDQISKHILLRFHYRSHKDIIHFSNHKYYGRNLIVKTEKPHSTALGFIDVKNDANPHQRHSCPKEAAAINQLIQHYKGRRIGVITPFRQQKSLIESRLKDVADTEVEVGTIHSFQGDEKDVVILSLSISPDTRAYTFEWLKNNRELINVASTRAKDYLLVVGDEEALRKQSQGRNDLKDLVDYVKRKGQTPLKTSASSSFKRRARGTKPLNTSFEDDFLKTLEHLFTVERQFMVKRAVRPTSIFESSEEEDDLAYLFTSEFDFVVFDAHTKAPLLIVELDGIEHRSDAQVKRRDAKKEKLCSNRGILLHRVPNEHARRYHLIREDLIRLLSG